LGMPHPKGARLPALGIHPNHDPKTLPNITMIPDRLLGSDWQEAGKLRVVLEIVEGVGEAGGAAMSGDAPALINGDPEVGAVSAA